MIAVIAAVWVLRDPVGLDEREAVTPLPSATWTPVMGDGNREQPSISRSPVPAEQADAYGVLRRPQSAGDRSAGVQTILRSLRPSMVNGVRVDAIRRLYSRGGQTVVLVSVEQLRNDPRDPSDDVRNGLCLFTNRTSGGSGGTCAAFHDALNGRMRHTMPPRGLAPDGATRVTVRVRGGRTVSVTPRNNYYDLSWVGEADAVGIARPRYFDAAGKELRTTR
jgi:hypothetical protein